ADAGAQLRREAGAERTLEAVRCSARLCQTSPLRGCPDSLTSSALVFVCISGPLSGAIVSYTPPALSSPQHTILSQALPAARPYPRYSAPAGGYRPKPSNSILPGPSPGLAVRSRPRPTSALSSQTDAPPACCAAA